MTATTKRRQAENVISVPQVQNALRRLTAFQVGPYRVVSCYLKLEPRDRERTKYQIKLKNRIRLHQQAIAQLGLQREYAEALRQELDSVLDYLRRPDNLPRTQGVAIFVCQAVGLFEAVPMPTVHRSRVVVERTPLIRELVSTLDRFGRIYAAVIDRTAARIFEVTATGAVELIGVAAGATRGGRWHPDQDGPGWGEHKYHNRLREEKERHYEEIARELRRLDQLAPARGFVLAGMGPDAGAAAPFLPNGMRERLLGIAKLAPREATPGMVHEATIAIQEEQRRKEAQAVVAEMQERLGEKWAVNGLAETLRALDLGQVKTLLVHPDANEPGFRCSKSGRVVLDALECTGDGSADVVVDVVDDAIEEALRRAMDVVVVREPKVATPIDQLAALLRYR